MASISKPKIIRRANPIDREKARDFVALFRKAQKEPDGRICLNPDDEPEIQTWLDVRNPEPLLLMLEDFAEHGTFQAVGPLYESIRLLPLRHAYRSAREGGQSHQDAVATLAEIYHLSTRTIERMVRTDKS